MSCPSEDTLRYQSSSLDILLELKRRYISCIRHQENTCDFNLQMSVNRYSNMSNIVTCSYDDRAFFAILRNPRRRERLVSLCLCRQGSKRWRRCLDAGLRDDVPPPSSTLPSPTSSAPMLSELPDLQKSSHVSDEGGGWNKDFVLGSLLQDSTKHNQPF